MSTRSLRQLPSSSGVEYYYYDNSDRASVTNRAAVAVELDRFVDEVEQSARHSVSSETTSSSTASRGGILLWSTPSLPEHLRGLVISNMMSSAPAYNDYARRVLMPEMDQAALAEIQALEAAGDIENPRYTTC